MINRALANKVAPKYNQQAQNTRAPPPPKPLKNRRDTLIVVAVTELEKGDGNPFKKP